MEERDVSLYHCDMEEREASAIEVIELLCRKCMKKSSGGRMREGEQKNEEQREKKLQKREKEK